MKSRVVALLAVIMMNSAFAGDFDSLIKQSLDDLESNFVNCKLNLIKVRHIPAYNRREIDIIMTNANGLDVGFFRNQVGRYQFVGLNALTYSIEYTDHEVRFVHPLQGVVARANTYRFGLNELRLNGYCKFSNVQPHTIEELYECVSYQFTRPLSAFMCYNS